MTTCNNNFHFENRFHVLFGSENYKTLNKNVIDITVPSINIGATPQPTNIKTIYRPGDSLDFGDINMTFLLDEDYSNYLTLVEWLNRLRNFREVSLEEDIVDIAISLLDAKYKNVFTVNCEDCFIYNISDVFLNQQIDSTEPVRFLASFKVNNIVYTRG